MSIYTILSEKKTESFLSISDIDEINITLFYLKKPQKFDKIDFFGYISDIDEIKWIIVQD